MRHTFTTRLTLFTAAARPNVMMFHDSQNFDTARSDEQEERYDAWVGGIAPGAKLVVVEVGAGTKVDTIRGHCECLVDEWAGPATLVRINLDESDVSEFMREQVSDHRRAHVRAIAVGGMGALEALRQIDAKITALAVQQ